MAHTFDLTRRLAAEAVGTAILLGTVVGSGIMAEALADGNTAVALLGNTLATGAILVVIILVFGPVSGAHFNPAVTLAFRAKGEISTRDTGLYIVVQIIGAIAGGWIAHAMFELDIVQFSTKVRAGPAQWFSEAVATFSLLAAILGTLRWRPEAVPYAVGLVITAGYWWTASTSFANPAVTIARSMSDTFAGIAPVDMPPFIMAQVVGALAATAFFGWLFARSGNSEG